jgi:hypothetical protein
VGKRPAMGDDVLHSTTSVSVSKLLPSYELNAYNELVTRMRSVTMHPLGLLLTKFFHPNEDVKLPTEIEFEPVSSIEQMNDCQLVDLNKCVSDWARVGNESSTNKALSLIRSLTESVNNGWSNNALYASHQDSLELIETASNTSHTTYYDLVVHRAANKERNVAADPAALLIKVGHTRCHPLTKMSEDIYTERILMMDMLVDPMLLAVVRFVTDNSTNEFQQAEVVVFLVIRCEDQDFRTALLWRGIPKNKIEFSTHLAKILQAAEFAVDWNSRATNRHHHVYLGPHCCRIGNLVRSDSKHCWFVVEQESHQLYYSACRRFRCFGATIIVSDSPSAIPMCICCPY